MLSQSGCSLGLGGVTAAWPLPQGQPSPQHRPGCRAGACGTQGCSRLPLLPWQQLRGEEGGDASSACPLGSSPHPAPSCGAGSVPGPPRPRGAGCAQSRHSTGREHAHGRSTRPHAQHTRAHACTHTTHVQHTHGTRVTHTCTRVLCVHADSPCTEVQPCTRTGRRARAAHQSGCLHTCGEMHAHVQTRAHASSRARLPGDIQPTPGDGGCGNPREPGRRVGARGLGWEPMDQGGSWPLGTPHPPGDATSPQEPRIPLGGARRRRRSRSRGQQTNTLYSIVTTVRITDSRAPAEPEPAMSHPSGPGRGCPSAKNLFLQDNRYRNPSLTRHYKGDPERWCPSAGCAGAPTAPGAPGPLGHHRGGFFLREVWFIFIIHLLLLLLLSSLFALSLVMTGCRTRTHTRSHTHASQHRAAGRRGAQREGAARWGVSKHYNHTAQKIHHCPQQFSPDEYTQRVSRRGQEGGGGDGDEADGVVLAAGAGGGPGSGSGSGADPEPAPEETFRLTARGGGTLTHGRRTARGGRTPRKGTEVLGEICARRRAPGPRDPTGTPNPADTREGAWGAPGTRLPGGGKAEPPGAAARREQATGVAAGPARIWLFQLGWGWVRWGMAWEGGRDRDALYTGNTCLMRDARLPPQASTRTGATETPWLTQRRHTHAQLPLHTDTSTMLMVAVREAPPGDPKAARDGAGGHRASLRRARGRTSPSAAAPVPCLSQGHRHLWQRGQAGPLLPAAPGGMPGPQLGGGGGVPFPWSQLRPAPQQWAGLGQRATRGTGSPEMGRQSPRELLPHCPPAPHCLGRVRGAPAHPEPLGNRGHGGPQRLLQVTAPASPAQLLQALPAPVTATATCPGLAARGGRGPHWHPTQQSRTRAQPLPHECSLRRPPPSRCCSHVLPGSGRRRLVAGRSH